MSETKHTPGEWKIEEGALTLIRHKDESDYAICTVHKQRDDEGLFNNEHLANAKLIAAAPDMLEALIKIRDFDDDTSEYDDPGAIAIEAIKKATA